MLLLPSHSTDTLDLQDHVAPSAKDHHANHPHTSDTPPGAPGVSIAPHQAETLREVAHKTAEAEAHSPRVSWSNGKPNDTTELLQEYAEDHSAADKHSLAGGGLGIEMYHHDQQDALAIAQNGGVSSTDEEDLEGEGDDLDDDLMDKISSSPSIEDGALNPVKMPAAWPRRESSLTSLLRQLDSANVTTEAIVPVAASCVSAEEVISVHETSVSKLCKLEPIAEWQRGSSPGLPWEPSSPGGRQDCNKRLENPLEPEVGHHHGITCPSFAMADCSGEMARLTKA